MPVVYSQEDLRPLLTDHDEARKVLDIVEQHLLDRHTGHGGHVTFSDLPLDNEGDAFRIFGISAPDAATLRIFPSEAVKAKRDVAFVMVLDEKTGSLKAILAGDDLNGLRTSVPAAVGARHLAPEGASVLGVLGSSEQARTCAWSITHALPELEEVLVWSPTKANRERFAEEQTEHLGLPVRAVDTDEEAVRGSDVLAAAGRIPHGQPAYDASWVKPGAVMISLSRSAPEELMESSQYFVATENNPQIVAAGFTKPLWSPQPPVEGTRCLADVIAGKASARDNPEDTVVFELANIYQWDHAIADWACAWAEKNGTGTKFDLTSSADA